VKEQMHGCKKTNPQKKTPPPHLSSTRFDLFFAINERWQWGGAFVLLGKVLSMPLAKFANVFCRLLQK
jgi:hypothetical protein